MNVVIMLLHVQELQTSSCHTQEAAAKDARSPKFRARNRYADVSPCKCWAFIVRSIHFGLVINADVFL